jgi:hypothetical protein
MIKNNYNAYNEDLEKDQITDILAFFGLSNGTPTQVVKRRK